VADSPTAVGNCCRAIRVLLLLLLLFSFFPYFFGPVIAHILKAISNPEGISAWISFPILGEAGVLVSSRSPVFGLGSF
jgi:hypothetical protein